MNNLELFIDQHPILGLVFALVYLVVFKSMVIGVITAFKAPRDPEDLLKTDAEKTHYRAYMRIVRNQGKTYTHTGKE